MTDVNLYEVKINRRMYNKYRKKIYRNFKILFDLLLIPSVLTGIIVGYVEEEIVHMAHQKKFGTSARVNTLNHKIDKISATMYDHQQQLNYLEYDTVTSIIYGVERFDLYHEISNNQAGILELQGKIKQDKETNINYVQKEIKKLRNVPYRNKEADDLNRMEISRLTSIFQKLQSKNSKKSNKSKISGTKTTPKKKEVFEPCGKCAKKLKKGRKKAMCGRCMGLWKRTR